MARSKRAGVNALEEAKERAERKHRETIQKNICRQKYLVTEEGEVRMHCIFDTWDEAKEAIKWGSWPNGAVIIPITILGGHRKRL